MTMSAGRNLGGKFSEEVKRPDNLLDAIDEVCNILEAKSCLWGF